MGGIKDFGGEDCYRTGDQKTKTKRGNNLLTNFPVNYQKATNMHAYALQSHYSLIILGGTFPLRALKLKCYTVSYFGIFVLMEPAKSKHHLYIVATCLVYSESAHTHAMLSLIIDRD